MVCGRTTTSDRPTLQTGRLSLRRPVERDVGAIIDIVGDWDVARRLARVPHPYGHSDAVFFLDEVVPNEWVWAITRYGSDRLIGVVGLTPEGSTAELGYWLSPAWWGRGVMTEAAQVVIDYGSTALGLPFLTSGYFADNSASGRVLQKLGFIPIGSTKRSCLARGVDVASIDMRLDKPDHPLLARPFTAR